MADQSLEEPATTFVETVAFLEAEAREMGWKDVSDALDVALSLAIAKALRVTEARYGTMERAFLDDYSTTIH